MVGPSYSASPPLQSISSLPASSLRQRSAVLRVARPSLYPPAASPGPAVPPRACDVCVHARGGTAGPGEAAGGNREGRATRKTAERCRSEEAGSEEIDCRGGEAE